MFWIRFGLGITRALRVSMYDGCLEEMFKRVEYGQTNQQPQKKIGRANYLQYQTGNGACGGRRSDKIVKSFLRNSDLTTRISPRQLIIFLPDPKKAMLKCKRLRTLYAGKLLDNHISHASSTYTITY